MSQIETKSDRTTPRRRRWLCVAYAFPPIRRSGTHRTLGFVRHLCEWGWDATVLTIEPGAEPIDDVLSGGVPSSMRVLRTPWTDLVGVAKRWIAPFHTHHGGDGSHRGEAAPQNLVRIGNRGVRDWVSRLLQTPDSRLGWLLPAVRAGIRAARQDRAEVIYSTSPYGTAHLIALVIAAWTRKPWVADFRDPWVDNPFREMPYAGLRWWDCFLETRVLRRASHVVCATPTMTARMIERHPKLLGKCTTILNGFDPARLERITPLRDEDRDACVLVHAGQFYGSRNPRVWLEALRAAGDSIADARPIRLHLIGPTSFDRRSLAELAREADVEHAVRVLGERSHAETLARIAGADGVLLPTASGPGADLQVPNKLFEYLALRRPILAAADPANPVRSILGDARADAAIVDPTDALGIAAAMKRLAADRCFKSQEVWTHVDDFSRVHRARELLQILEAITTRCDRTETHATRASTADAVHAVGSYPAAVT